MSINQNLSRGSQKTRGGTRGANIQLCINKQWVESSSNQWPQWTESHLIFLIQRFGLCPLPQDKITHLSIDAILQATMIYLDKTGWKTSHEDRLWEKLNLKIGYLHAGLTGQRDQALVDHLCKQRLHFHAMYKKNLSNLSSNRDSNPLSSSCHRQPIPVPTPTFQPAARTGRAASQYRPDVRMPLVGPAMDLWLSMSTDEQANLLQSQLQTAKNFNTLVKIVDRRCQFVQASRARQTGHESPTKTCNPLDTVTANLNTNINPSSLRLQTSLSPSAKMKQEAQHTASSYGGSSKSPDIMFDGLPSPTTTPKTRWSWSTTPSSAKCSDSDKSQLDNKNDDVQDAEVINSGGSNKSPILSKAVDVNSIITNCIRELEMKRKRERDAAQEKKRMGEQIDQEAELEEAGKVDMIQNVEEEESEERRKRCKIQIII